MLPLRSFACLTAVFLLAGCSLPGGVAYDPDRGLIVDKDSAEPTASAANGEAGGISLSKLFGPGSRPESAGYVVGDEPFAVKAGASILSQGGSAADAAAAMYFTMSVTYPGAAGLGGGGLCVAFDQQSNKATSITFLARNAAAGGAYGVPGNVRGMAALQAQFGTLPFARTVAYAEALAATGFPISDALEARLLAAQNVIRLDAGLSREFLDESGKVKPAGSMVTAPELATTLAAIRQNGAAVLYNGEIAEAMVKYSKEQGGALSLGDLRAYAAQWHDPQAVMLDTRQLYLPPVAVGAGNFAGGVFSQIHGGGNQPLPGNAERVAELAVSRTAARFGVGHLPKDMGSTGFAALDKNGQAVACAVTMNGPFGSGHTVPGTGVALPRTPSSPQLGLAAAFLTPAILVRNITGPIRLPDSEPDYAPMLAGAGAGGPEGAGSVAVAAIKLVRGEPLTPPGSASPAVMTPLDALNGIACDNGTCSVLNDPATGSLGLVAGRPPSGS